MFKSSEVITISTLLLGLGLSSCSQSLVSVIPGSDSTLEANQPETLAAKPENSSLIYQSNPTDVTINDLALVLATLQVEVKTAEAIANRANELLDAPSLIAPDSLDPVPSVSNTNYVLGAASQGLDPIDVAAVLATLQIGNQDVEALVIRINELLDTPDLISASDIAFVPGLNVPTHEPDPSVLVCPQGPPDIVVTTLTDVTDPNDNLCSLREAITAANQNIASGSGPNECTAGTSTPDQIDLSTLVGDVQLATALPAITGDLNLVGSNHQRLVRNATDLFRLLTLEQGTVFLCDLALVNGNTGTSTADSTLRGGGIRVNPGTTAALVNVTVEANTAPFGGGIYNLGTLLIENSTFRGNTATAQGGAISNNYQGSGSLVVSTSLFENNSASDAGAILQDTRGSLVDRIQSSLFFNNTAISEGGALLVLSSLTIQETMLRSNTALTGGAIVNDGPLNLLNNDFTGVPANTALSGNGPNVFGGNISGFISTGNQPPDCDQIDNGVGSC